jgi:hypothetical protein
VAPEGSFSVEGIVLQEGENTVKVIAVDACGNQGEDQILVYLRTAPQGPQLVLCAVMIMPTVASMENEECKQQAFARDFGSINGYTDETAVSVTLNGILLPDEIEIIHQGMILWGLREGTYFYADVKIPEMDGIHPFTAVATDVNGRWTETTVTFIRDTVSPQLTITSPSDGLVTNNPTITITGTVDDPEAIVSIGWGGTEIPVINGRFTAQVTLEEGVNYIEVTAMDPAWNFAYVGLEITLDTIPPQINIATPVEGAVVNTSVIQVAGTIIDQHIDTINVSVNNGQPESLTLTGSTFSGTVTLSLGSNTLIFHAIDKAGNAASTTRSVLLDLELPAVTITAPQPGVVLSSVVTVTAEAIDAMSGIASVILYVDGQMQTTLSQPPFNFTLETSIFSSGIHTITVRARDRAGNESEASVSVTIDNTAPLVAITSPSSGAVVSGSITVSVQANDAISGMASVSLYVDGLLQATLTQSPFNFSLNTLLFASGSHTLTARGIDDVGNQAEASITILFDHVPPALSITSPSSGAIVSGTITVTVDANDPISGVASVSLYLNNQPHSTLNQPPYSFSVDTSELAPGSHTLTARAIDNAGNQAEASITVSVSHFRAEIISPANGATVNKSAALVQGRIYNSGGEIGVVINGVLAEVQGNDFAAIVPLQVGQNILTAVATTVDGFQVQTSVTINTASQQEMIRFTVYPSSGIIKPPANTLEVTFEAEAYLPNPISSYSWDFNGDGTAEITGPDSKVVAQYQYPGLYSPSVAVRDTQGNVYSETTLVNVTSKEEIDALLRSKWEGMRTKLSNGDIEGALVFLDEFTKQDYRDLFNVLSSMLPTIVQELGDIQLIENTGNTAIYDIRTIRDGIEYSFQLLFTKDINGIWRIDSF